MPSTIEDEVRRTITAFNAGRVSEARHSCESGLARAPAEPILNHLLAALLFADGEIARSRHHIERSLAAQPGRRAARLLANRIAVSAGDFAGALAHLDAIAERSGDIDICLARARTMDAAGWPDRSLEAWQIVLSRDGTCKEASFRVGRRLWEAGRARDAAGVLEHALADGGPASAWFDLALACQDIREFEKAALAYRKVLDRHPDNAEAAVNLGSVLQEAGDRDGAIEAYGRAYRLKPSTFGMIAMALSSAKFGGVWLDLEALRQLLLG